VGDIKSELSEELINEFRRYSKEGSCAGYIPALREADSSSLGLCTIDAKGIVNKAGEWDRYFTIQSISKIISLIAVCSMRGISYVLDKVDLEPTGDPFNSIIRLETNIPGKPFNPLINAGAITVASMVPGISVDEKFGNILMLLEEILGRKPEMNQEIYSSEWENAMRNRAIAFYLKEKGFLDCRVEDALEVYTRQCSIEVTTMDLAKIGLLLAYDGYDVLRERQIFSSEIARLTKAVMITCGLYNASGKFAAFVGVPAKSGVAGGILAVVPPRVINRGKDVLEGVGIGIYGPAVDENGNSVAGVKLLQHLAKEYMFSAF